VLVSGDSQAASNSWLIERQAEPIRSYKTEDGSSLLASWRLEVLIVAAAAAMCATGLSLQAHPSVAWESIVRQEGAGGGGGEGEGMARTASELRPQTAGLRYHRASGQRPPAGY